MSELAPPDVEAPVAGRLGDLIERVHPLSEIVEVLAVALPLEPLVERLAGLPLPQRLADPEPAERGMRLALELGQPAEPAAPCIVRTVPAQHAMHALDQLQRMRTPGRLAGRRPSAMKLQTAKASVHR